MVDAIAQTFLEWSRFVALPICLHVVASFTAIISVLFLVIWFDVALFKVGYRKKNRKHKNTVSFGFDVTSEYKLFDSLFLLGLATAMILHSENVHISTMGLGLIALGYYTFFYSLYSSLLSKPFYYGLIRFMAIKKAYVQKDTFKSNEHELFTIFSGTYLFVIIYFVLAVLVLGFLNGLACYALAAATNNVAIMTMYEGDLFNKYVSCLYVGLGSVFQFYQPPVLSLPFKVFQIFMVLITFFTFGFILNAARVTFDKYYAYFKKYYYALCDLRNTPVELNIFYTIPTGFRISVKDEKSNKHLLTNEHGEEEYS